MMPDSSGGILGYWDNSDAHVASVEVKTMTTPNTIRNAKDIREIFDSFSILNSIGMSEGMDKYFRELLSTTAFRFQCIHLAATLGISKDLFIVAKGSSGRVGEVIHAILLHISEEIRNYYLMYIDAVRVSDSAYVGRETSCIPAEYNSIISASHASDMHTWASVYSLCQSYKHRVQQHGPLPPSRMIKPIFLLYWSALKGGVDEFSRALTTLAYTNTSEHPIASIIRLLFCAQVAIAAIVHRLGIPRDEEKLPPVMTEYSRGKGIKLSAIL